LECGAFKHSTNETTITGLKMRLCVYSPRSPEHGPPVRNRVRKDGKTAYVTLGRQKVLGPDALARREDALVANGLRDAGVGRPQHQQRLCRLTFGFAVAVLSGRHPGQDPFAGRNPEALAGDVLPIANNGMPSVRSIMSCLMLAATTYCQ
jgi:hypothetical protein